MVTKLEFAWMEVVPIAHPTGNLFLLDHQEFLKSLKTARRGAAPGASGMTT